MKKLIYILGAIIIIIGLGLTRIAQAETEYKPTTRLVIDTIVKYSREYGVNTNLAFDIAFFESRLTPNAKNPNSSAKGVYQFINSTWKGLCEGDVLNYKDNIRCAMKILSDDSGISHWTADKGTRGHLMKKGYLTPDLKLKD